jgi:hypothetical protein
VKNAPVPTRRRQVVDRSRIEINTATGKVNADTRAPSSCDAAFGKNFRCLFLRESILLVAVMIAEDN